MGRAQERQGKAPPECVHHRRGRVWQRGLCAAGLSLGMGIVPALEQPMPIVGVALVRTPACSARFPIHAPAAHLSAPEALGRGRLLTVWKGVTMTACPSLSQEEQDAAGGDDDAGAEEEGQGGGGGGEEGEEGGGDDASGEKPTMTKEDVWGDDSDEEEADKGKAKDDDDARY
jgi:hypothetical protein